MAFQMRLRHHSEGLRRARRAMCPQRREIIPMGETYFLNFSSFLLFYPRHKSFKKRCWISLLWQININLNDLYQLKQISGFLLILILNSSVPWTIFSSYLIAYTIAFWRNSKFTWKQCQLIYNSSKILVWPHLKTYGYILRQPTVQKPLLHFFFVCVDSSVVEHQTRAPWIRVQLPV